MKMIVTFSELEKDTTKSLFPTPLLFDNSSAGNVMRIEMMIAADIANSNSSCTILILGNSWEIQGAARITIDLISTATTAIDTAVGITKSQYRMDLADESPSYIASSSVWDPAEYSADVDVNPIVFGDSKIYYASMEILR
jgi:hypothetical protein